jgi:hypothetical protein
MKNSQQPAAGRSPSARPANGPVCENSSTRARGLRPSAVSLAAGGQPFLPAILSDSWAGRSSQQVTARTADGPRLDLHPSAAGTNCPDVGTIRRGHESANHGMAEAPVTLPVNEDLEQQSPRRWSARSSGGACWRRSSRSLATSISEEERARGAIENEN